MAACADSIPRDVRAVNEAQELGFETVGEAQMVQDRWAHIKVLFGNCSGELVVDTLLSNLNERKETWVLKPLSLPREGVVHTAPLPSQYLNLVSVRWTATQIMPPVLRR